MKNFKESRFIVGIEKVCNRNREALVLTQSLYACKEVEEFGMVLEKSCTTPTGVKMPIPLNMGLLMVHPGRQLVRYCTLGRVSVLSLPLLCVRIQIMVTYNHGTLESGEAFVVL